MSTQRIMKKRADGRYLKQITDKRTGRKICFYGKTAREVNQKILQYTEKAIQGATFGEIAEDWWEEKQEELDPRVASTRKYCVNTTIAYFRDCKLAEIEPKDITLYLQKIAKMGYSESTVRKYRTTVNQVIEYAILHGYIKMNACASVKMPKGLPKKKRNSAGVIDEETIKNSADKWIYPSLALYTGMRRGEILGLKWKDIDLKKRTITVSHAMAYLSSHAYEKTTKTSAGERTIPIVEPLAKILKSQPNQDPEYYVISSDGVHPLTPGEYTRKWKDYQAETGIKCTSHQLRHSFASIGFEAGIPVKTMQGLLGHATYSTTMDIYTDLRQKSMDDAAKLLDNAMSQSKISQSTQNNQ